MATVFAIAGLLILLVIIGIGIRLNKNPAPKNIPIVCYLAFVFILGFIPFWGEARILTALHNTKDSDLVNWCSVMETFLLPSDKAKTDKPLVQPQSIFKNFYIRTLIQQSSKYDQTYKLLVNKNMCTNVCPCYSKETWNQDNTRIDPIFTYGSLSEERLNIYNRTKVSDSNKYAPMVFTDNRSKGFQSFQECFEAWTALAIEDDEENEIDLLEVFGIDWQKLQRNIKNQRKPPPKQPEIQDDMLKKAFELEKANFKKRIADDNHNMTPQDIAAKMIWFGEYTPEKGRISISMKIAADEKKRQEYIEGDGDITRDQAMLNEEVYVEFLGLEMLSVIEQEFQCSGFCKSPLFYLYQSTYLGVPEKQCLGDFVKYLIKLSRPLVYECYAVAFTLLLLWFNVFALFGKKISDQTENNHEHGVSELQEVPEAEQDHQHIEVELQNQQKENNDEIVQF